MIQGRLGDKVKTRNVTKKKERETVGFLVSWKEKEKDRDRDR